MILSKPPYITHCDNAAIVQLTHQLSASKTRTRHLSMRASWLHHLVKRENVSPCNLYPRRARKLTYLPRVSLLTCVNLPDRDFDLDSRFAMACSLCVGLTDLSVLKHVDSYTLQTFIVIWVGSERVVEPSTCYCLNPALYAFRMILACPDLALQARLQARIMHWNSVLDMQGLQGLRSTSTLSTSIVGIPILSGLATLPRLTCWLCTTWSAPWKKFVGNGSPLDAVARDMWSILQSTDIHSWSHYTSVNLCLNPDACSRLVRRRPLSHSIWHTSRMDIGRDQRVTSLPLRFSEQLMLPEMLNAKKNMIFCMKANAWSDLQASKICLWASIV